MNRRLLGLATLLLAAPAAAQDDDDAPRRTRVAIGPQLVPAYPGSDTAVLRPYFDVSRTRGDAPFTFEAPDESTGLALLRTDRFSVGPAIGFEGARRARDVGTTLPRVGFTVEAGGFVQYQLTDAVRLRGELRQGIGGHQGLIGSVGADYVARDADRWLLSAGPRVTFANDRYARAYFTVRPQDVAASGLPAFDAGGGVQAVGLTVGAIRQLSRAWGIVAYAKYDRLVGDAADSPIVRRYGSRNQPSAGIALSYTFGRGVE